MVWLQNQPLLVDVKHEVVLAYDITDTKAGDGETLPSVLEQAQANLPEDRIKTLAYDKAADSGDHVHRLLSDEVIMPVIQLLAVGKSHRTRMLPGHDGSSNIVYKEDGTTLIDKVSEPPVLYCTAYIGDEPNARR